MNEKNGVVNCIRKFNRFYTVQLGFLNQNYLEFGFSVTETRILFEVNSANGISASHLWCKESKIPLSSSITELSLKVGFWKQNVLR